MTKTYSDSLIEFVRESNKIERIIRHPSDEELEAHYQFLLHDTITVERLQEFVSAIQPDAVLRNREGLNVRVGNHIPQYGGIEIEQSLIELCEKANRNVGKINSNRFAFQIHKEYETIHPFTDGNGRSGRALWLWQMGGFRNVHLGFLHTWYYQSLDEAR